MSKKDYVEIGGIMTRKNGKKYEVKESPWGDSCDTCAFSVKKIPGFCDAIPCCGHERKDGLLIIFIRRKDLETERNTQSKTV